MATVFVTNKNDFVHTDSFDGEEYVFPPNEKVALSVDAARHMFGMGEKDLTDTLVRLGWALSYDPAKRQFTENKEGFKRLTNFVFTKAVMVEERFAPSAEVKHLDIV